MSGLSLRSSGLDEVILFIDRIDRASRISWQNKFIKQIGKVALKEIKRNVPKRTGKLRDSFRIIKRGDKTTIYSNSPYAVMADKGVKRHDIVPRHKPALIFRVDGKLIITQYVDHPGYSGRNYLKKTVSTMVPRAMRIANKIIRSDLKRYGYLLKRKRNVTS